MSAFRPYGSGSPALDRLLQNPAEFGYSRMEGYPYRPEERNEADETRLGGHMSMGVPPVGGAPTAKRGSKACVACRKGKNRCEGDPTGQSKACRRCAANGLQCVFEKPSERGAGRARHDSIGVDLGSDAEGRVASLEKSVHDLAQGQSQIQQALAQILSVLPNSQSLMGGNGSVSTADIFTNSVSPPSIFSNGSHISPQNLAASNGGNALASGSRSQAGKPTATRREFPKLPGFAPPNHRFGTYGIIPASSTPGSPNERSSRSSSVASDAALPQDSMTAPIQALETLAHAADQAAAIAGRQRNVGGSGGGGAGDAAEGGLHGDDERGLKREDGSSEEEEKDPARAGAITGAEGSRRKRKRVEFDAKNIHIRVKKKTKPDPTPRNPFPDVVTKGLVTEQEARQLWDIFFLGCHYFVPLWDKTYDTYETFIERTPFSTNGLLAVAAKVRAGNGPLGETFHRCLEEAQGIARSTLFGPIVRKEAVLAMLVLSLWSQNGWLPCGHALRMGLDMNLHRALDKLAETEPRSEAEERDLVVSARIWLNCYMFDHLASLGTGKPLLLRDDSSVRLARTLLSHPMVSETDLRLIAGVELVNLRVRVSEHLAPLHGRVDSQTISFVKRTWADLQQWHHEWHRLHLQRFDESHVLVMLLEVELVYAQLWTVCVALRGCQWKNLPPDQRELAFQAKDAAMRCIEIFLKADSFRAHLKYATHDQLASAAFAAVFVLKIALLYPSSVSLPSLISQVNELAHVLSSECFAERYALTLRLMLANFRRKTGALSTMPGTPRVMGPGEPVPLGGGGGVSASGLQDQSLGFGDDGVGSTDLDGGLASLLTFPSLGGADGMDAWAFNQGGLDGFAWPTEFSPSNLPTWLQDGNLGDLGLPQDGSDSLFLPLELANMFLPEGAASTANYQWMPDSVDFGTEAW